MRTTDKDATSTPWSLTELIRQLISIVLVVTGAFWLLCAFVAFTLVQTATVAQVGEVHPPKLSISTSVFTVLALLYTTLGLGFGNRRKAAWQQLFASSLCYLSLGLYILLMWQMLVPEFNQQLLRSGRLPAQEIDASSDLATVAIALLLIAAPAITLSALLLPEMRQRFDIASVVYSGRRNLYQCTLLWYSFGLAVLLLMGAGFDPRHLGGDPQGTALGWFWAAAAASVAAGGVLSYHCGPVQAAVGWLLNIGGLSMALVIGFRGELDWQFLMPPADGTSQILALSFLVFYAAFFSLYSLLNLGALWRAPGQHPSGCAPDSENRASSSNRRP